MTDSELIDLVERMRVIQRDFFKWRDPSVMHKARELERQVDREIAQRKDKQPKLFAEEA